MGIMKKVAIEADKVYLLEVEIKEWKAMVKIEFKWKREEFKKIFSNE